MSLNHLVTICWRKRRVRLTLQCILLYYEDIGRATSPSHLLRARFGKSSSLNWTATNIRGDVP